MFAVRGLPLQHLQRSVFSLAPLFLPAWPASSASARPAAPTTKTRPALRLRSRFIHIHRPAVHLHPIKLGNGIFGSTPFGHFDEGESPRLTRIPIRNDIHSLYGAILSECGFQLGL